MSTPNLNAKTVICMKWGSLYSSTYVNVLFNACSRSISGPYRFVCFTDDPQGLSQQIIVRPIPEFGLDPAHYRHGAWPKLGVFLPHEDLLSGRCLFIDLDTVLLDSLDPLFEIEGSLVCIDSRPWRYKQGAPRTGTGIFAFDAGRLHSVLERFRGDIKGFVERYKIEQDFLHGEVPEICYWPEGWVVSFKYHARQPLLIDRFRPPKKPEPPAKVLAFHGKPRPIDLIEPPPGNWDIFPHYGSGKVDWMVDYWYANK
jgi:hypothetical protein